MSTVCIRWSRNTTKDYAALGVTQHMARILLPLLEATKLICGTLAERTGLDPAALSRALRALESQKLIVRQRGRRDNRWIEVRLTAKGRQLAQQCRDLVDEQERAMLSGMDGEDIEHFLEMLARMTDNAADYPRLRNTGDGAARPNT